MMLTSNTCPHCSAPQADSFEDSWFYTCQVCNKVYYFDSNTKNAELNYFQLPTISAIIEGSRGTYTTNNFKVTGRITIFTPGTVFTFHALNTGTGKTNYLVQWFGNYCFIDSIDTNPSDELLDSKVGKLSNLNKNERIYCHYSNKIKNIGLSGSGKLFFQEPSKTILCCYYTKTGKGYFGFFSKTEKLVLSGPYVELTALNLTNTRNSNDWYLR